MNLDGLDPGILGPAFVAGLLVLTTHIPLGQEVIRRGIIFIDLAIAQFAGVGVILAATLGFETHGIEVQAIALTSALMGAALLGLTERLVGEYQEALIGVGFVLAATAGILLLAGNPQGGEHLRELLVGQILWVEWHQLLIPAVISVAVILNWYFLPRLLKGHFFYFLFALSITASVQLVGIYLVFASLIIPALATIRIEGSQRATILALVTGALAYALGLIFSAVMDLPSGASIVWMMAVCGVLVASLSRWLPFFAKEF